MGSQKATDKKELFDDFAEELVKDVEEFLINYRAFYVKIGNPSYMKKCQYILMLILKHLFPC